MVAFVKAASLVVDENDAAADHHHHHEDRHRDRARQQVLDVGHVGIQLDDVEGHRAPPDARRSDVRFVPTAATSPFIVPASALATKLSVLSAIRATCGA
jgi:hypothetical protein